MWVSHLDVAASGMAWRVCSDGWVFIACLFFFVTDLLQDPYFFVSVLVRVSNSCPRNVLALVLR